MILGVPAECYPGERRVALVPALVQALAKSGAEILLQAGVGSDAGFLDAEYEERGAQILADRADLFSRADLILQVHGFGAHPESGRPDLKLMRRGQAVVAFQNPLGAAEAARELAETGVSAFALELLPRISRAQSMDALSSMATVAGYKAVLLAAAALDKMFPLLMTAAGTVTPARVLVVGAGVAGLQAIATARRLGAVVRAYDVRPAVKEQVESLGAKFVELALPTESAEGAGGYAKSMGEEFYRRQREAMTEVVSDCEVLITTAAVPGKRAPVLFTDEMIRTMRSGSVVVDLAAESGGNCESTRAGETVLCGGVSILGPVNLPSTIPHHASQMYAHNVVAFVRNLIPSGKLELNLEDPVIRETLLTHDGEVISDAVRGLLGLAGPATLLAAGRSA